MENRNCIGRYIGCLTVLLLFVCAGCGSKTPDAADAPQVIVFAPGQNEYTIVMEATGSDAVYHCADMVQLLPEEKPELRNDRWEETPLELLIGETDRAITVEIQPELDALATEEAFHFAVAEKDGKILLLADHDLGYQYLEDYLPATYMKDGVLSIPIGCRDIQTVTWEEYHASPYYAEVLKKEEERMKREEEKAAQALKQKEEDTARYAKLVTEFDTANFGQRKLFPENIYPTPEVKPGAAHPRILFTPETIDTVRANLTHEENADAYKAYLTYSDSFETGILLPIKDETQKNMNYNTAAIIEAKAFRYAMTGDEYYGYQAIYAIKNMILTLDAPKTSGVTSVRDYGYVTYIAGCVYDWCYDLLTEECKTQILNGCISLMGKGMKYGAPPKNMGAVYGNATENELLRDWLTLGIACYDEAPDIYNYVAGWILSDFVEANEYMEASWNHWEGSMYGPNRFGCQMVSNALFDRMTNGTYAPFSENPHELMYTLLHYIRPDQQVLRIGDTFGQTGSTFSLNSYGMAAFYVGNYYRDPVLRQFASDVLRGFARFTHGEFALSPITVLALNDPSVGFAPYDTLPVTRLTKDPLVSVFARTTWEKEDEDAAMVYMTMPRSFGASHAHMDCGSFQIYYKGILASDSGVYDTWGGYGTNHSEYSTQTVSANSILVYNPNLRLDKPINRFDYSGGQSVKPERVGLPSTLTEMLSTPSQHQCTTLGAVATEGENGYQYAYVGGDMTAAYDAETVDEVTRYMFSATTGEKEHPLLFVTFDRITSDDASYRKSALIHMEEEPLITEDGFAIITNTARENSGKLILQSVMTDTEYTVIGGEGKRYWKVDENVDTEDSVMPGSVAEYGWGRIEISPAEAHTTDHLLTVMYVTDATNEAAPVRAADISTDTLAGTQLFGCAVLFPKHEKLLTTAASCTLENAGDCYIAGVAAGQWRVQIGSDTKTVEVKEGENLLAFTATSTAITITPIS